jgi:hypothetical protein
MNAAYRLVDVLRRRANAESGPAARFQEHAMTSLARLAAATLVLCAGSAIAASSPPEDQPAPAAPPAASPATPPAATPTDDQAWEAQFAPDPESPVAKRYAEAQKRRLAIEREFKLIRAKHFRNIRGTEMRQAGIVKMKAYDEPALFPSMLEIFGNEGPDVQGALLDHWSDLNLDEADATITWTAVFSKDKAFREAAKQRLLAKAKANDGHVSNRIKSVIAIGLRKQRTSEVVAAAELARDLRLFDAIPMLIAAQAVGQPAGTSAGFGGGGEGDDSALAYIVVGQQVAFVSDLTPVVGDNAVAFDPTLAVATEGVVMRVMDAFVVTYRIEVNSALIGLANSGWDGRSTAPLGWNGRAWREWYVKEFLPYRKEVEAVAGQVVQKK